MTDASNQTYLNALYSALTAVPVGRVVTYGQLAAMAGRPGAARWAGHVLRQLPVDTQLPWHRVVGAGGKISLPKDSQGYKEQCQRLAQEGVSVRLGRLSLKAFDW